MLLNIFLVITKRGRGVSNILKVYLLLNTKIKIRDEIYRYKHAIERAKRCHTINLFTMAKVFHYVFIDVKVCLPLNFDGCCV